MQNDNGSAAVWEDPPPPTARRRLLGTSPLVAELKENQGRWARFATYVKDNSAYNLARRISKGQSKWAQPAGSFEAVVREVEGKHVVYVRYVGEGGAR